MHKKISLFQRMRKALCLTHKKISLSDSEVISYTSTRSDFSRSVRKSVSSHSFGYNTEIAGKYPLKKLEQGAECLYCGNRMRELVNEHLRYQRSCDYEILKTSLSEMLYVCSSCGWWIGRSYKSMDQRDNRYQIRTDYAYGVCRKYETGLPKTAIVALESWLTDHPNYVAGSAAFGKSVSDCLKDAYAPCEVKYVGAGRDDDIEIIMIRDDSQAYLIRVQGRKSIRPVRELSGVLFRDGFLDGIVISAEFVDYKEAKRRSKLHDYLFFEKGSGSDIFMKKSKIDQFDNDILELLELRTEFSHDAWERRLGTWSLKKEKERVAGNPDLKIISTG